MEDMLINWMKKNNIPVNRKNYLTAAYLGNEEEQHGAEREAELPKKIRYERVPEKEEPKQ